jgi:hypothetical protein
MMFGILYAASPEVFPAKQRGTGNGLTATAARVFGVLVRLLSDTPLVFLPHTDDAARLSLCRPL